MAVLLCGGLLAAGTSVGGGFPFGGSGVEEPDLILVNGEILTMDQRQPRAGAIAITDDEITAVGSSRSVAKLAGRRTQTINLRGRTVIPGWSTVTRTPFAAARRSTTRPTGSMPLARGGARQGRRGRGRA